MPNLFKPIVLKKFYVKVDGLIQEDFDDFSDADNYATMLCVNNGFTVEIWEKNVGVKCVLSPE